MNYKEKSNLGILWKNYFNRGSLSLSLYGFYSGLPLALAFGVLSFWLRKAGVDRSSIGLLTWCSMFYALKFCWAPFLDLVRIPFLSKMLGHRRSWLFLFQCFISVALFLISTCNPAGNLDFLVYCILLLSFCSATQDVIIDGFRIESSTHRMHAALAAVYIIGYRFALIVANAGSMYLVYYLSKGETYSVFAWQQVYFVMAALMATSVLVTVFIVKEPEIKRLDVSRQLESFNDNASRVKFWFISLFFDPFKNFFTAFGVSSIPILLLIGLYRISDITLGAMSNVFYADMGFTELEVANISKVFGVIMTLVGAFIGGLLVSKYKSPKILLLGALLSALTNLLFIVQFNLGHDKNFLMVLISLDNLSGGIATSAFIAFMSSLVDRNYSATQYSLLSSIMLIIPKFVAGFSGIVVDDIGYQLFFLSTFAVGIPAIFLSIWLIKTNVLYDHN